MSNDLSNTIFRQLQLIKFEKPKASQYVLHIYADFVELIAFYCKEELSIADVSDLLIDVRDANIINTEIDDLEFSEIASLEPEKNDIVSDRIISIFDVCKERSLLFNDEYPFIVTNRFLKIKEELSYKQRLYFFLLAASNLNYFTLLETMLTTDFEYLSYYCLKSFLPDRTIIKSFGKKSEYHGNAINKILALSNDMGLSVNEKNVKQISTKNTQERGLDIVAWMPFEDKIPNMLMFFCQCACGKNWDTKQTDTVFFANYFHFDYNEPIHSMFIPYSLATGNNEFAQSDKLLNNLLFDRKRIIEQISKTIRSDKLPSLEFVEKSFESIIPFN